MNQIPFRQYHLLNLMNAYERQKLPLDLFVSFYFRDNKALGSKDRGYIADSVYGLIRWRKLLDFLCQPNPTWEQRVAKYENFNYRDYLNKEEIPLSVRLSFPEPLMDLIISSHGMEKGKELCRISNFPAPTTVRINLLKTTREKMLSHWKDYGVTPGSYSDCSVHFSKKLNFFSLPEFTEGLFEVQDEGSQLLANLVQVKPGQQVLDYCSGSGGKALAFAPKMEGKGQIFLHDIRSYALQEAKKRLRRAGIQNAQTVQADDESKLKKMKKKMDWVLVDVPCSGTGTLRRNPDMKWKFSVEFFQELLGKQRMIFEKALSFMAPKGRIVYATCSLLNEENQDQLAHFIKTYHLEVEGEIFQSFPSDNGMDGFFGVVLKHKT